MAEARYMDRAEYAEHVAAQVMADPDALGQYETGLLPVADDVARALDRRLLRVRRGYVYPDSVSLVNGMHCDG